MYSRGKMLVELAVANSKRNSDDERQVSDLESKESTILLSSESDEDPIYNQSDSASEFERSYQVEVNKVLPENASFMQDSTVSSSTDKSPCSPVYEMVPPITLSNERNLFLETEEFLENENPEGLPECNNPSSCKVNRKHIRKPDFCYYCETEIQNFARHIQRNHSQEFDVQKVVSLPPKSIERKRLIAYLRKKGNFLKNSEYFFKPVHKSLLDNSESNYLPCPFCLGIYSRKLLWRHKRICPLNKRPDIKTSLGEGQNLLLPKFNINSDLKSKVFPRMLADRVSFIAKKDPLICAFGSRYLNTHREQHHINVCSRKIRELAKVLMESQKINPAIKNLFDLLQPQHFDVVVQGVKVIAKYDPKKDIYLSPTFAMNISRSLKDCCDIAILHIVKRKYNYKDISAAEAEANVTMFIRLLESTWKYEISSQAGNDLNTKTWNKVTLIPLAADLKLFRTYLINKGDEAGKKLKENRDNLKMYILLMETVFCRLLLLNRKRVGELQRMKLATYMLSEEKNVQNYEEFAEAITPTEKVLLKSFKRVVIRGKRGRGVPVLFSKDMQDHIKLILQARPHFVQETNLFLFANPKSDQPIVGYKVLQKHAHLCGAKNPIALTSTKLRKHLATLTQVFNMTPNDIEQLATFMGHTINVHSKVYRLPDDVFQTAKIAKLLILMERGEAAKFKGKALEEIELNIDEEIPGEHNNELDSAVNNIESPLGTGILEDDDKLEEENIGSEKCKTKRNTTKRKLIPWTAEQKEVVLEFFKDHIKYKKPPKKNECITLSEMYPDLLTNKSWTKIKVFVQNCYTKKAKHN